MLGAPVDDAEATWRRSAARQPRGIGSDDVPACGRSERSRGAHGGAARSARKRPVHRIRYAYTLYANTSILCLYHISTTVAPPFGVVAYTPCAPACRQIPEVRAKYAMGAHPSC